MSEIVVSELTSGAEIDQFDSLSISESGQNPYRFIPASSCSNLDAIWCAEIVDYLSSGHVFVARDADEIVGVAVYADLPWDTEIFDQKMGALKYIFAQSAYRRQVIDLLLDHLVAWASDRGIDFLLYKAHADDVVVIHALEKRGFLLMDTLLDYVYDSRRNPLGDIHIPILGGQFLIRSAEGDEEEELIALARFAFSDHFGRFHADERIPRHRATQVYQEWIRSSLAGYADLILVAEANSQIAGCSIWKEPSPLEQRLGIRLGHYSIGLVHPDFHRQGVFTALTYAGMVRFDGVVDYIEGPTHVNNHAVQRGYTKLHWRIQGARHSFHKWLRE